MPDRSSNDAPQERKPRSGNKTANRGRGTKGKPDGNELAFRIVQQATSEPDPIIEEKPRTPAKNPAAVTLGRLGGLKGGKARAQAAGRDR